LVILIGGTGVAPADNDGKAPSPSTLESAAVSSGVTPLTEGLDALQVRAQSLAITHPELPPLIHDHRTGRSLRTEVFAVYPARATDVPSARNCPVDDCYRTDIYNFALNETYSVIADVRLGDVIVFLRHTGAQADLPERLTNRAIEIATTSDEVIEALGFRPGADEPSMPNVKTALNRSSCERSRHLCVAPTFLLEDRALWAIVDLTDERLVGTRWTDLDRATRGQVTEESIKSEEVFEKYCRQPVHLEREGWSMDYILTSSDGLQLSNLTYEGRQVLRSAKLVDWHVSYSTRDGFGYSDADGCRFIFNGNFGDNLYPEYHHVLADALYGGKLRRFVRELKFLAELGSLQGLYRHSAVRQIAKKPLAWRGRTRIPGNALTPFANGLVDWERNWPPEARGHPRPDQYRALLGLDAARGIAGEGYFADQYGVELVEPYVDWDLVDFVLSVPSYVFWNLGETKHLMREAMKGRIPESVRSRPRGGLLVSFYNHGMDKRIDWIKHRLFSGEADWPRFAERSRIKAILEGGKPSERERMLLWQCVTYEMWLDRYFR